MSQSEPEHHGQYSVTLGVDIGGTFTDVTLMDARGQLWEHKISTSTGREFQAFIDGALTVLARAGVDPTEVNEVIHASTIATNAVLERKGPVVGLITTEGFRDVLEIGRIRTPSLYDLEWEKPRALVSRRHRMEVRERIGANGKIVLDLDEQTVLDAIRALREAGVSAIAVSLINSPVNDEHEQRIKQLLVEHYPECGVSLSSEVLRELKEYERTSTTVINAYLQPVLRRYLGELRQRLNDVGIMAPLQVMRSDGGMMSEVAAQERPIACVISGPAAGVLATQVVAERAKVADVLAFDMGGTTAKASLVEDGNLPRVNEYEVRAGISTPSRFIKAGGYLLMVPAVDLAEVGNGAGSIARVDAGLALHVGPESAGAVPGPACYDRGGTEPTITDANLVLGYLNPGALVGGDLNIDRDLATCVIGKRIADPLGISPVDAAWGIHCLANSNMMRAIRSVTVERGRDPRSISMVAFGGSGPVHAAGIAAEMKIPSVIVPRMAGLLSAVGLLTSRTEKNLSMAWIRRLEDTTGNELQASLEKLIAECRAAMAEEKHVVAEVERFVDLRFVGQSSNLTVRVRDNDSNDIKDWLAHDFVQEYERTYGHSLADEPIEIANLRVILRAPARTAPTSNMALPGVTATSSRQAYFGTEHGYVDTPVVTREALSPDPVEGPLLIDEYDTTVVVPPRCLASVTEEFDDLMIEVYQ